MGKNRVNIFPKSFRNLALKKVEKYKSIRSYPDILNQV